MERRERGLVWGGGGGGGGEGGVEVKDTCPHLVLVLFLLTLNKELFAGKFAN